MCCKRDYIRSTCRQEQNPSVRLVEWWQQVIRIRIRTSWYGVATISRLLKIIGLFCRISSLLKGSFAKETYHFKEPTSRSHPIFCWVHPISLHCARLKVDGFFFWLANQTSTYIYRDQHKLLAPTYISLSSEEILYLCTVKVDGFFFFLWADTWTLYISLSSKERGTPATHKKKKMYTPSACCHGTYVDESCHTCKWVMLEYICMKSQTEEIRLKIITTAKRPNRYHGSPHTYQAHFYGGLQNSKRIFSWASGVPVTQKIYRENP